MSFIANHAGRNPVDVRRAEKLKEKLAEKGLLRKEPSLRNWIMEFGRLRKYGDKYNLASPDQIDAVLSWYCKNMGRKGIPDIRSAGIFRTRFSALKKAMENAQADDGGVRIRKSTKLFIAEYLSDVAWPKDSHRRLPVAVQQSADNHAIMIGRLETFVADYNDTPEQKMPDLASLAFDILADSSETPTFICEWFMWVYRRVRTWEDWNGSFRQFIFTQDHKRWRALMSHKGLMFGDPSLWDQLQKGIA